MVTQIKPRIIVIERDPDSRRLLEFIFNEEGYDFEFISSAEKGMRLINKKHYDLILSEITLEKMSGLELLKEVRRNNPTVPFIIITGYASLEASIEAINLGVTHYLMKPIDPHVVREVLRQAIRHHQARFAKHKVVEYHMENSFSAIITSEEQSIIQLLDTVDNLIELVYPAEYGPFPDLRMAIYECLSNALEHGNQYKKDKSIHFSIKLMMDRIIVSVKDEGDGFNFTEVEDESNLSPQVNHGLKLVKYLMDEITFNLIGTEISMLKLLDPN